MKSRPIICPCKHLTIWVVLFLLMAFFPESALSQTSNFEKQRDAGKQALMRNDFLQALGLFQNGFDLAETQGNTQWKKNFLFYLGLTEQRKSETVHNIELKKSHLEKAAHYYQKVLEMQPDSGPSLNNLAQVYTQIGRKEEAAELFKKAIHLQDTRQALYAVSFADALLKEGKTAKAIDYYKIALNTQPENNNAQENLANAYISTGSSELLAHLWKLVENGKIILAQENAVKALINRTWPDPYKVEFLTVTVACLSHRFYNPKTFLGSDSFKKLNELLNDPKIGKGVEELFALYKLSSKDPSDYRWWARKGELKKDPERGVWPREAFRMLIRSIGKWYSKAGDVKRAEAYYLLSATLYENEADPNAFLALADLYMANKKTEKLSAMIDRYGIDIFRSKAGAYRNSHMKKIYEYHKALGVIYAHLGNWGSSSNSTSAIFQIENAIKVAELTNRKIVNTGDKIRVEPRLIGYLSKGYSAINKPQIALNVRLAAADQYILNKDTEGAREVLKPISKNDLQLATAVTKTRYATLKNSLKKPTPPARYGTIKIGALNDITGATSDVGKDYAMGIAEAIHYVNDQGGVNGKQIKLYQFDYGCRIPEALTKYELFKSLKCVAVLGWGPGDTEALSPKINKDKIPYVSASYSAHLTNPKKTPYNLFFATDYSTNARAAITAWFDKKWPKHKDYWRRKPRFICSYMFASPYSSAPIKAIKDQAKLLGFDIGPDQSVSLIATDTKSQVLAMKDFKPDLVWHGNTLMSVVATVRDSYALGLKGDHIVNNWAFDENLIRLAGKASDGVMGVAVSAFFGEDAQFMDKVVLYAQKYNPGVPIEKRMIRTVEAWGSVMILWEALKRADKAGDLTGEGILKKGFQTLENFNIGLGASPVTFTATDHRASGQVPVYEIKNGKFVIVERVDLEGRWPQKWANDWLGW